MAGLNSPRVQYRLYTAALKILWVLMIASSLAVAYCYNRRMALIPLMGGLSVILLLMWRRDYIARRMEQRRKPYKIKEAVGGKTTNEVHTVPEQEPTCR